MKQALTSKQVQYMKPSPEGRLEIPAGPPGGLYFVIQPTGSKSWALRYRWRGISRKLTLGSYPAMSLAAARGDSEARLAELESGSDPAIEKAIEKAEENPDTVEAVAEEWLSRYVKKNLKSWRSVKRVMNKDVVAIWRYKRIDEISKKDVIRLLDGIVDRGAHVQANRVRSLLHTFFKWCVERDILKISPVAGTEPPTEEHSRERVLDDGELSAILSVTEKLGYPNAAFMRMLLLSAQRRGEVAGMRWEDVNLERAIWTLPKWATKAGRIHDVPLSRSMLTILEGLPRFAGPYIFTTTSGRTPINGFPKMKKRIDASLIKAGYKLERWTMHDLRRSGATWMAGSGVFPHVLGALLNHSAGKTQGITAIYNRFRYTEERRAALEKWGEHVVSLETAKNLMMKTG